MAGSSGQEVALDPLVRPWYRAGGARDEASLIRQARRGSADAIEALVRRHWESAHRAAYLIVHDAHAAEGHRAGGDARGRPLDRRLRPPWLHRIVVNRSLD